MPHCVHMGTQNTSFSTQRWIALFWMWRWKFIEYHLVCRMRKSILKAKIVCARVCLIHVLPECVRVWVLHCSEWFELITHHLKIFCGIIFVYFGIERASYLCVRVYNNILHLCIGYEMCNNSLSLTIKCWFGMFCVGAMCSGFAFYTYCIHTDISKYISSNVRLTANPKWNICFAFALELKCDFGCVQTATHTHMYWWKWSLILSGLLLLLNLFCIGF